MKLEIPIESLELDLSCIENELKEYFPPICKWDDKYKALLEARKQVKEGIKILKRYE